MSAAATTDNRCLVTEALVKAALKADKGDAAGLVSFRVEDFTNKGDNYACIVTGVAVRYREGEQEEKEARYVAKITHPLPQDQAFSMGDMIHDIFEKESTCYTEIAVKLNEALRQHGITDLRFPKGFASCLEKRKEAIMLEDLRPRGFKMYDRRRGMDVPHATLVLQEVGRLHAASVLMEAALPNKDMQETWPLLVDKWISDEKVHELFQKMSEGQMEAAAMIMEKVPNYENVAKWIRDTKQAMLDLFLDSFRADSKFKVLTHGDCWNNNVLFRYDDDGKPVEVMLVDLQVMRKVSPALDLTYFLYSSFNGPDRKNNLQEFLKTYYDSFSGVLAAADFPVPFTHQELQEEFRRRMIFGCLSGLFLIPIVLSEPDDVADFMDITDENIEKFSEERKDVMLKMSERSDGLLRPRFLDMFDEMVEAGIIPT